MVGVRRGKTGAYITVRGRKAAHEIKKDSEFREKGLKGEDSRKRLPRIVVFDVPERISSEVVVKKL